MNACDEIGSGEFSLLRICAVRVVSHILMARKRAGVVAGEEEDCEVMKKLPLPNLSKQLLAGFVKPVNKELDRWYNRNAYYPSYARPIFTAQGSLDITKMARLIVDDENGEETSLKYVLACVSFQEDHRIAKLLNQLSANEVDVLRHQVMASSDEKDMAELVFAVLWLDVFPLKDPQGLSRSICDAGFRLALKQGYDIAMKYFIQKASPAMVRDRMLRYFGIYDVLDHLRFSPATYSSMFAKLSKVQRQKEIGKFSVSLLISCLQWPHQPTFLKVAHSMIVHLDTDGFRKVLESIAKKMAVNEDYDYQGLFSLFWKLGDVQRHEFSSEQKVYPSEVFYLFMAREERLARTVLRALSAEEKTALLRSYKGEMIAVKLMCDKDFDLLEMFVRQCVMENEEMLKEFQIRVEKLKRISLSLAWVAKYIPDFGEESFNDGKRRLVEILVDIVAK